METFNTDNNINQLTIANWNANGLREKRSTFISFILNHNVDIACVTETHLKPSGKIRIPGYQIYRCDRDSTDASGGAALIIKRKIKHHSLPLPALVAHEAVAANIELASGSSFRIIAAYRSPNRTNFQQDLKEIFSETTSTILCGDLNAKSTIWGCRAGNNIGNTLHRLANEHNLLISAPSEYTHYPYRQDHQPDILDIAVLKNFKFPIHQTVYDELDSDHVPVVIKFVETPKLNSPPPRLINGKIDWLKFQTELDKNLKIPQNLDTDTNIDISVKNLTKSIITSVHNSVTSANRRQKYKKPEPQHILALINEKHAMRRLWQTTRSPEHKRALNRLTHRVKWELDNYTIQSYRNHIAELEPGDPSMWRATKRILRQPTVIPSISDNGYVANSDIDKCHTFAKHLATTFDLPVRQNRNDLDDAVYSEINSRLPATVTLTEDLTSPEEIKSYIDTLSIKKSPGHDKIPNIILKKLTGKALACLSTILNACLARGYFPTTWKHAEIILFHKPGKPSASPSSYRPISLLTTLSKLLEAIIYRRLDEFLNNHSIIPHFQFGFRSKHSTTQQLLRISEIINRGFEIKAHTVIVFLDIQQAFDKVWIDGLIYKMLQLKLPPILLNILVSFLRDRTFCVKINNSVSEHHPIKSGIPQGSKLGPILFNIYVHDVPTFDTSMISMYADDTALISQDHDISVAADLLQSSLDELCKYFDQWKLRLNPSKSEAKIFTLRRPLDPPKLTINNQEIPWNQKDQAVKYLGVHLDRRLTFGLHINKKLNECHTRLVILYPLLNRNSSLKMKCSLLLYKSILRPILLYACPVWGTASRSQIRKIQTMQNKILRISVNAPWFMRNTQIHRETGVPYITDFIAKATKKFLANLQHCPGANYYQLGMKSQKTRLKNRLPQDIYCNSSDSDSD